MGSPRVGPVRGVTRLWRDWEGHMNMQISRNDQLTNAGLTPLAGSRRGSAKKGCLIALVVVLILAVGIGVFVYTSWKGWTASIMTATTEQIVQQTPLAKEEKDRIVARVSALGTEFKDGKITMEQLGGVLTAIAESPILPSGMVIAAERKYINPSGLPNEEKEAGRRSLQRLARGVVEKKVTMDEAETAAAPITTKDAEGKTKLKETATDAELREFLANAKAKADEKNIPDEAYVVNFADELDKVINESLGRTPPAPTTPSSSTPSSTPPVTPPTSGGN